MGQRSRSEGENVPVSVESKRQASKKTVNGRTDLNSKPSK